VPGRWLLLHALIGAALWWLLYLAVRAIVRLFVRLH
jgi:hypothetical protein